VRIAAVAFAVALTVLPTSAANPGYRHVPAGDINLTSTALEARKAVGLPAIADNSAVLAAAGAVLDGSSPQPAFRSAGGTGNVIVAAGTAGGAFAQPDLQAAIFDPRLSAIAVLGRDRKVAVAAILDPARPFREPVRAGAIAVDPGLVGSIAFLFPPRFGTIPQFSLQRHRGRQLVSIGIAATAVPGRDGAVLVQIKGRDRITGPQIGYGLTYTLKIGSGHAYVVQTRPIPSELVSRGFVAGPGFNGADRQLFMKLLGSLPPQARKIIEIVGGAITVSIVANSTSICGAPTSCAGFDAGNGYFMIINRAQLHSNIGRFAITHELGHIADFMGLDTYSHEDFRKLFAESPKWKSCFRLGNSCTPFLEVFADQFGFFSTNAQGVQSGYGDDRLATSPGFAAVLGVQWAFRPPQATNPLAGFGPLAKSFANALYSGEGAL
jgi:hypothetical protein